MSGKTVFAYKSSKEHIKQTYRSLLHQGMWVKPLTVFFHRHKFGNGLSAIIITKEPERSVGEMDEWILWPSLCSPADQLLQCSTCSVKVDNKSLARAMTQKIALLPTFFLLFLFISHYPQIINAFQAMKPVWYMYSYFCSPNKFFMYCTRQFELNLIWMLYHNIFKFTAL